MSERGAILVVDDDRDVRETIRDYFEHCGFEVYVAGDGEGMRKALAGHRVDLVLMDLYLPGTDGLALTRELRSKHDIGIIMLTAAGQVVDRIVGKRDRASRLSRNGGRETPPLLRLSFTSRGR